jgi:hypothetical protein
MSDSFVAQIRAAFAAYRRSVGDYHQAERGADSARAVGIIEESYKALIRLAVKADLPRPPAPQARNRWHGDWSDWGPWLQSVDDWWVEAEARLSIQEERTSDTTPPAPEPPNSMKLVGEMWLVRFEEDGKTVPFKGQKASALRHLARLLAEPCRRFGALEFYPPPPDKLPKNTGTPKLPHMGRDATTDDEGMQNYEKSMTQLAQEIKEAGKAGDSERADKLREQFDELAAQVKAEKKARKRGHKKRCGTLRPSRRPTKLYVLAGSVSGSGSGSRACRNWRITSTRTSTTPPESGGTPRRPTLPDGP